MPSVHFSLCVCLGSWLVATDHDTLGSPSVALNPVTTTAELDIYMKDLVRRCQFSSPEETESHKIDPLHHATAHFEVRKFVHSAKPEELSYDKMVKVAKSHERICQEYQIQAHLGTVSYYQNPLFKQMFLSKSFHKLGKRTCGKCGRSHNHGECPAWGQTCHQCGKKNHWSQMCRAQRNSSTAFTPSPTQATEQTKKTIRQQAE